MATRGLFVLVAVAGCSGQPEPPAPASLDQTLTPERAKAALLEMMRSKAGSALGWFDGNVPYEMGTMAIEDEGDGWYRWTGAFTINPSKAIYTFVVQPRPGARACVFEYKGSFAVQNGRWAATPPQLTRAALQAGE